MKRCTPLAWRNGDRMRAMRPPRIGRATTGGVSGTVVVAAISVPDPWVDHRVDDVDDQADDDNDKGEERDQPLDPDVVAVVQVGQQLAPQPGPTDRKSVV